MDSDSSADERAEGIIKPIGGRQSAGASNSAQAWSREPEAQQSVNVYHNELFTEGDVLGGGPTTTATPAPLRGASGFNEGFPPSPMGGRQGSTQNKIIQQQKTLAARRQERMQANVYERNESLTRNVGNSPMAGSAPNPFRSQQQNQQQQQHQQHENGRNSGGAGGDNNAFGGLRSSYDPNEEAGARAVVPRHQQQQQQSIPPPIRLDLSDMATFLATPGPKNGPILCYIVRDKGSAKMYPKYNLFLEDGKRFLLAARKRKKQTTSNYVISLDYDDLGRDSEKYFGKLRSNFVGTEFTVFDDGDKPGAKPREDSRGQLRQELAAVLYQYNVLGTRGPRKMTAAIPAVDGSGRRLFKATSDADCMLERIKSNSGQEEMVVMRNKPPRWNEELNAYCLNFNGRVTEASVKNFQLVTDDNQGHVICQFGKIGKNTFTMDYQWPICALQAFGICLSSFDNKLACE